MRPPRIAEGTIGVSRARLPIQFSKNEKLFLAVRPCVLKVFGKHLLDIFMGCVFSALHLGSDFLTFFDELGTPLEQKIEQVIIQRKHRNMCLARVDEYTFSCRDLQHSTNRRFQISYPPHLSKY